MSALTTTSFLTTEASPTDDVIRFHWADYFVFGAFLVFSAGVGVVVSLLERRKQTDAKDFLTGGGTLHYFPVALSMMASFLSAIFVISIPAEMYIYNTNYALLFVSYFIGFPIAGHVYLPVFYRLGITSGYEYLEMRFSKTARICGSLTFSVMMLLYNGVVLYTPAVALSQVSGLSMSVAILSVGLVVTFYTALGGMKATVWNDAVQMFVILFCFIIVIILGSIQVGGFAHAIREADSGGRLTLFKAETYNPDPFIRTTFWTQTVGGTFINIVMYASSQTIIQKFISTKTVRDGQKAVWLSSFTTALMMILVIFIGCIIYTKYEFCDPIASGKVQKIDQIVAFFVMEIMGHLHGLPGLFLAASFSATLSSVSGGINALAAVYLEDVIIPIHRRFAKNMMETSTAKLVTRGLVVFFGLTTIAVAFLSDVLGKLVIQIAMSIFGVVGGPLAGMITLGLFFPTANNWGALAGLCGSLVVTFWLGVGAVVLQVPQHELPVNISGCSFPGFNATLPPPVEALERDYLKIYELSFMYYSILAIIIVIIIALPVSKLTGGNKEKSKLDPRLYYFFQDECCTCFSPACREKWRCGVEEKGDLSEPEEDVKLEVKLEKLRRGSSLAPEGIKIGLPDTHEKA